MENQTKNENEKVYVNVNYHDREKAKNAVQNGTMIKRLGM